MKSEIQYFLNKSPYGNKQLQYHKPHTPEKPDQYYTKKEIDYLLKNIDISNKVDKEEGKGLSTNDYTTDDKNKLNALPTNKALTTLLNGKVDTDDLNEYVPKIDGHGNQSIYGQGNITMTLADEQGVVNQIGSFWAGGWSVSSPDGRFQTFGNTIYRGNLGIDEDSVVWENTATQQIPTATTEVNGLMLAADKGKLNDLPTATQLAEKIGNKANSADLAEVAAGVAVKQDKMPIVQVASGTTAIIAAVNTYYEVAGEVGALAITLPTPTDLTKVAMVVIHLTAGTNPKVVIGAVDNPQPDYSASYDISASKEYEINCLYNGDKWVVADMEVV